MLANSLGIQNFKILKDGTIKSQTIADMNNRAISRKLSKDGKQNFKIDAEGDEIYAHLSEYQKWIGLAGDYSNSGKCIYDGYF